MSKCLCSGCSSSDAMMPSTSIFMVRSRSASLTPQACSKAVRGKRRFQATMLPLLRSERSTPIACLCKDRMSHHAKDTADVDVSDRDYLRVPQNGLLNSCLQRREPFYTCLFRLATYQH
ncbi:hypothetical protein KCU89_g98, partial [Aureobasidium melanogenum]